MGRTRTPTSVLKLRGAFINHPSRGRDRENEPIITSALPEPPKYLALATVAMWRKMKSRGYWLTSADRFLVEIAATLMARYRADELRFGDVSQLIGLLGKIGFSPSERGKMKFPSTT
jgi:phage terminase small subunit